jgi:hypothetical protein
LPGGVGGGLGGGVYLDVESMARRPRCPRIVTICSIGVLEVLVQTRQWELVQLKRGL